ncbi:MAG: hypothetical protein ACKO70_07775, partial [Actinomycetota bacterium]
PTTLRPDNDATAPGRALLTGRSRRCPVFLDPDVLEDEVGAWWHAAMAHTVSNPPYERQPPALAGA